MDTATDTDGDTGTGIGTGTIQEQSDALWGGEKFILGPMVRANSAALRWACLHFGADVVYSEELLAQRAINCRRLENTALETIDFVRSVPKKGRGAVDREDVVFRTHCQHEKKSGRCVLQLGAADAVSALRAARIFEKDVAAIDINMGCAKHYAISGGMGAQLMTDQRTAEDIVKTLRRNLSIPVSVKTRVFTQERSSSVPTTSVDIHKSCEWSQLLQAAGASAITVHARASGEKMFDATHDNIYSFLYQTLVTTGTHLICNGDIFTYDDIERIRRSARGDDNVDECCRGNGLNFMMARAALWDPSIFRNFKIERERRYRSRMSSCSGVNDERKLPSTFTSITPSVIVNIGSLVLPSIVAEERKKDGCDSVKKQCRAIEGYFDDDIAFSTPDLLSVMTRVSALSANCLLNTQFLLQHLLAGARKLHTPVRRVITEAVSLVDISSATECESFVKEELMRQRCFVSPSHTAPENRISDCSSQQHQENNSSENEIRTWPGLVASTSHIYKHSYFDDNYYSAFRKVSAAARSTATISGPGAGRGTGNIEVYVVGDTTSENSFSSSTYAEPTTRKFAFSAFCAENTTTTVTTTKRKKRVKIIHN